jgi:hypothetical protein
VQEWLITTKITTVKNYQPHLDIKTSQQPRKNEERMGKADRWKERKRQ